MIRPAELLRAVDIAAALGITESAVSQWTTRYRRATVDNRTGRDIPAFPAPWLDRGHGRTRVRLYLAGDVDRWLAATGRDPLPRNGRP